MGALSVELLQAGTPLVAGRSYTLQCQVSYHCLALLLSWQKLLEIVTTKIDIRNLQNIKELFAVYNKTLRAIKNEIKEELK